MSTLLQEQVEDAIRDKIANGEAFTPACISHPLIEADENVRHTDVNRILKDMWQGRRMSDGTTRYIRTLITVWPNGVSGAPAQAFLYYPDNGYDPNSFNSTDRVLVRNKTADTDGATSVVNAPDGSPIRKQCQIQPKDKALNIPKLLIDALGWKPCDELEISSSNGVVRVEKVNYEADQRVDQEGRVRLYGKTIGDLGTQSPTVMLVKPDSGNSYLLISQLSNLPDAAPAVAPATTPAAPADASDTVVPGSVWSS